MRSAKKRTTRRTSPTATARAALAGVCAGCSDVVFVRGPSGVVIGGAPLEGRRWLHDALDAVLVAGRARGSLAPTSSIGRALDDEIEDALVTIENHVRDLDELDELLADAGLEPVGRVH